MEEKDINERALEATVVVLEGSVWAIVISCTIVLGIALM